MPLVTYEGPLPYPGWQLRDPETDALMAIPISSRLSVNTIEAAVTAAVRNVGITRLLLYQVADFIKAGKLQVVLEQFEPRPAPVSLVHAARGHMPLKMRRFLDFAAPRLRATLAKLEQEAGGDVLRLAGENL